MRILFYYFFAKKKHSLSESDCTFRAGMGSFFFWRFHDPSSSSFIISNELRFQMGKVAKRSLECVFNESQSF